MNRTTSTTRQPGTQEIFIARIGQARNIKHAQAHMVQSTRRTEETTTTLKSNQPHNRYEFLRVSNADPTPKKHSKDLEHEHIEMEGDKKETMKKRNHSEKWSNVKSEEAWEKSTNPMRAKQPDGRKATTENIESCSRGNEHVKYATSKSRDATKRKKIKKSKFISGAAIKPRVATRSRRRATQRISQEMMRRNQT